VTVTKADIRRVAEKIAPSSFLDAREYLAAVYQQLKQHFGQYSYVRFTEDMGFGACNAMHLIIHGQRPLTSKGALKIAVNLGLTGVERKYFLNLVAAQQGEDREEAFDKLVELKTKALPTALDRRQLEFYNHWYNAAILELLSLPDASDDPAWLSARLTPSVPPTKVDNALKLLVKLGHVVKDKDKGRLVPSEAVLTTGNEVLGMAVMRYHQQMIALAKDSLTDVAPLERDISAVTIAVPAARTAELKAKIQAFRKDLLEFSKACTGSDEIVQINIQLFPLARIASRSKRDDN
jgi:uncharacterized protein (TIGR02147 family)